MKSILLVASILMMMTMPSYSFNLIGGSQTCGDMLSDTSGRAIIWVTAFVSGLNSATPTKDILEGQSFNSINVWLKNYCRNNPLNQIKDAAQELGIELILRTIKR
jgi:hypothetical protein